MNGPKLAALFERRWLPALNHLAAKAGLPEAQLRRMTDSAVEYCVGGQSRVVQTKLERLLDDMVRNGRICPQPNAWHEVWQWLPETLRPARPARCSANPRCVVGSIARGKAGRFLAHLRYAEATYMLDEVDQFLRSLPESAWFHGDG